MVSGNTHKKCHEDVVPEREPLLKPTGLNWWFFIWGLMLGGSIVGVIFSIFNQIK